LPSRGYDGCHDYVRQRFYAGAECNDGGTPSAMAGIAVWFGPTAACIMEGAFVDSFISAVADGAAEMTQAGYESKAEISRRRVPNHGPINPTTKVDFTGRPIISQDPLPPVPGSWIERD